MIWMRRKSLPGKKPELYHSQRDCYPANQDTHYFYTLCRKEVKGVYGNWEIIENPPKEQCCPECLKLMEND